jgi:UDP-N-acetylmuramoyl-tripeptide--D-alanyl-D-alanine ligase
MPRAVRQVTALLGARPDRVTDPAALVTGPVVIDSRQAEPGSLFAALPGERADGQYFAAADAAAGATVVLAQRPVGVPALIVPDVTGRPGPAGPGRAGPIGDPVVVGITGSAGKSHHQGPGRPR